MTQTAPPQSVVRPCDLSRVEESLATVWPASGFLPAILAVRDDAGSLCVRVSFRGLVRPHRVLVDADADQGTGWWSLGMPHSASGWDVMVGADGLPYVHDGDATREQWRPATPSGLQRSVHAGTVDLRLSPDLAGPGPVRLAVVVGDDGWAPPALCAGAAFPAPATSPAAQAPGRPAPLAVHLGSRPWTAGGAAGPADAADLLGSFAHVVLAAGTGPDAAALLSALRASHPDTEVWGRVSAVGESSPAPDDVASVLSRAERWRAAGATGVFLDDAGLCRPALQPCPSGELTRERQSRIVDGIHALGLAVFARCEALHDILGAVGGAPSPLGGATPVRAADMVMVECPTLRSGRTVAGRARIVADAHLDLAARARASSGVRFAVLDTAPGPVDAGVARTTAFRDAYGRAAAAGADAYGFANDALCATPDTESNLAPLDLPRRA